MTPPHLCSAPSRGHKCATIAILQTPDIVLAPEFYEPLYACEPMRAAVSDFTELIASS